MTLEQANAEYAQATQLKFEARERLEFAKERRTGILEAQRDYDAAKAKCHEAREARRAEWAKTHPKILCGIGGCRRSTACFVSLYGEESAQCNIPVCHEHLDELYDLHETFKGDLTWQSAPVHFVLEGKPNSKRWTIPALKAFFAEGK